MNTSVPVKYYTLYHRECAKEDGLISDFDDTFFYCSKKCMNKGDKYCDEELRNDKPKTDLHLSEKKNNNTNTNNNTSTSTSSPGRRRGGGGIGISRRPVDEDFSLSQDNTTTGGRGGGTNTL